MAIGSSLYLPFKIIKTERKLWAIFLTFSMSFTTYLGTFNSWKLFKNFYFTLKKWVLPNNKISPIILLYICVYYNCKHTICIFEMCFCKFNNPSSQIIIFELLSFWEHQIKSNQRIASTHADWWIEGLNLYLPLSPIHSHTFKQTHSHTHNTHSHTHTNTRTHTHAHTITDLQT